MLYNCRAEFFSTQNITPVPWVKGRSNIAPMTSLLAVPNSVLGSRSEPSIFNFWIRLSLKAKNGLNLKKILLLAKRFLTSFWIFFVPWWFSVFSCTSSHTSSYSHNHFFISEGTSCNKNEKTFAVWRNLNTQFFFLFTKKIPE